MTIPTGPTSLSDIQVEFGGTSPTSLGEYYAGGLYVPNPPPTSSQQIAPIPTSGPISIGCFLGVTAGFSFTETISSNLLTGYDLNTRAISGGWNQIEPLIANITVNSGVVISNGPLFVQTGFTTTRAGSYPAGSKLILVNNGTICGGKGGGGPGGSVIGATFPAFTAGGNGGIGLLIILPTFITNNGIIGGGGGGGGGGGASRNSTDAGITWYGASGGGGGCGAGDGSPGEGPAGTSSGNDTNGQGSSGTTGAPSMPGTGGSDFLIGGVIRSGHGGNGGTMGQPGDAGVDPDLAFANGGHSLGNPGGLSGDAISGFSLVTLVVSGTILGAVTG